MDGSRHLAAILFTDVVDFTAAAQRYEAGALSVLHEQEDLVRRIVQEFSGREVKSTGDGFLVEFPNVPSAAECAIAIQTAVRQRNADTRSAPFQLRIGLNVGDVESRDGDIFGHSVNLAARILTEAEPEGIALTQEVAHHLENRLAYPIESLGSRRLKGVDDAVPLFRIVLPWSGPTPIAPDPVALPRLAVLPLRNISPDLEDAYFADGLTEELASSLGQVRELRVIARSSVERAMRTDRSLSELGRELNATAMLEGSVRKAGDQLRISLRLIDVASEEELWTHTFDRQLTDIFAVQAEIGERTADSLRIRLVGLERAALSKPQSSNLVAYGLYLQALHLARKGIREDVAEAIRLFRRAKDEDPAFAAAYAHLASRMIGSIGETSSAAEVLPEARELIESALHLDPTSAEAHCAAGNLALQGDQNWAIAEAEFRRAIDLNPSDVEARYWFGLLLRTLQRYAEAADQFQNIMELDPLGTMGAAMLASILRLTGRLEDAEHFIRNTYQGYVGPDNVHLDLAVTYLYAGRRDEALSELDIAAQFMKGSEFDIALTRARLGEPDDAVSILADLEEKAKSGYVPLSYLAMAAAAVGENDRALDYLERDLAEGDRGLWFLYQGPPFDGVRSDPRFLRMLEQVGLPASAPFHRGGRAT